MQTGVSPVVHDVHVRVPFQQQLHDVFLGLGAGVLEGGVALPVPVVDVGAVIQQMLDDFNVAAEHGQNQRSRLCVVLQVDELFQIAAFDQLLAEELEQPVTAAEHGPVEQRAEVLQGEKSCENASHGVN